jgi:integrase
LALIFVQRTSRELEHAYAHGVPLPKTFGEACEAYLASGGSDRFLGPLYKHFGKKLLKDIAQPELDAAARKIYPNVQRETLNRHAYTPFIAVWNFAAENEWARPRKWRRPRRPKGTFERVRPRAGTFPVEYEHAGRFVAAMSPAPAMIMTTLLYSGMRPMEAFALLAPNVNVLGRWIVIPNSKTGEPRGVPMHEFLVPMFESLLVRNALAADARIFRTPRGNPYPRGGGGLKTAIILNRKRTGIHDIAPYTGRHTCSTGLVVAGVHPHIKDQILGHAATDMSRHYTNVPQAPLIEAINKLPVPDVWRTMRWLKDPLAWSGKLAEGTGRRTDLL